MATRLHMAVRRAVCHQQVAFVFSALTPVTTRGTISTFHVPITGAVTVVMHMPGVRVAFAGIILDHELKWIHLSSCLKPQEDALNCFFLLKFAG